jgi:hypothetical protein
MLAPLRKLVQEGILSPLTDLVEFGLRLQPGAFRKARLDKVIYLDLEPEGDQWIDACPIRHNLSPYLLAQATIDFGDLLHPLAALTMLQAEHRLIAPMEMVGDECYLLVERVERVAPQSPPRPFTSTSKVCSHLGQMALTAADPSPLIRL